ncbi:hypothetical protein HUS23_07915 [Ectothiorhodospiraceae bacterium 2226]|nr:hypothetical protein HUS23_07915 [Ectothiorhodospiraceae bacterium 2226]
MAERRLEEEYAPESNRLEHAAARYLRERVGGEPAQVAALAPEDVHVLKRVQRRAVAWAALAGAISGGLLGIGEVILRQEFIGNAEVASLREQLPYWAVYGVIALVISGLEILFLYWNALNGTARAASLTGVPRDARGEIMVRGLARAALEFPNPHEPVYGIDPYARTPRWKLLAWAAMYRMKVGVTSFILRVLLRRMLGRAALRTIIPLVAGPLYAVWNAVITYRILREVRVRAYGPHAIEALVARLAERELDTAARPVLLAAVAETMVRSEDAHPNFVMLLAQLARVLDVHPEELDCDWAGAERALGELDAPAQDAVLEVLALAVVLDGRVRRGERQLLADAHEACGRRFNAEALNEVRAQLLRGQAGGERGLAAVWARA